MRRRILEIGPGPAPMHHRSQEKLQLQDNEEYTGIEQPHVIESLLNREVWKLAKEQYGDRAHLVEGDRANLENIPDGSFDELVALGTHANEGQVVAEFNRVLREGGMLRLGTLESSLPQLMSTWGIRLQRLNYVELPDQQSRYGYFGNVPVSRPYVVIAFQKGIKNE